MGEGRRDAPLMLLGEQPGDREDRAGLPFVGPAGRVLDDALAEAGISPDDAFTTNVVKHFRWSGTRGKQRIHQSPTRAHITACTPWLAAEQLATEHPPAWVVATVQPLRGSPGRRPESTYDKWRKCIKPPTCVTGQGLDALG